MGGFMGLGNSSEKTDRGRQLAGFQAEWENLANNRNVGGQQLAFGNQNTGAGAQNIGDAAQYWRNILGSRQSAAAAVAPQTQQIAAQADAMRQAQAQLGTARGGGTAGTNQQIADKTTQTTI